MLYNFTTRQIHWPVFKNKGVKGSCKIILPYSKVSSANSHITFDIPLKGEKNQTTKQNKKHKTKPFARKGKILTAFLVCEKQDIIKM